MGQRMNMDRRVGERLSKMTLLPLQRNLDEARQWMEKAAAQGDESARIWLKAHAEVVAAA